MRMDPAHAAQYNWQLIEEHRRVYRLNVDGNHLEGPLFSIYYDHRHEGIQSGYFCSKKRWYAIDKLGSSEPLMVTWLKGVRVHFKGPVGDGGFESYIRVVRQYNSDNVSIPFCIEV